MGRGVVLHELLYAGLEMTEIFRLYKGQVAQKSTCLKILVLVHTIFMSFVLRTSLLVPHNFYNLVYGFIWYVKCM